MQSGKGRESMERTGWKSGSEAANPEWESALENGKRGCVAWKVGGARYGWLDGVGAAVGSCIDSQAGQAGGGPRWWGWLVVGAKHIPAARPELTQNISLQIGEFRSPTVWNSDNFAPFLGLNHATTRRPLARVPRNSAAFSRSTEQIPLSLLFYSVYVRTLGDSEIHLRNRIRPDIDEIRERSSVEVMNR